MYGRTCPRVITGHTEAWHVKVCAPLVLAENISQMHLVFQGQEDRVVAKAGQADGSSHVVVPWVETNRRRATSTIAQSLEGHRPVLASLIVTNFCRGVCQCPK